MTPTLLMAMVVAIFAVAVLYSAVGHGGASGYIAIMALFSLAPSVIKPSALILNILVATVAYSMYASAGHFRWRLFWPFAVTSIPASFIGGSIHLPPHVFKPLLGLALLCAASRVWLIGVDRSAEPSDVPLPAATVSGALIGIVSGMTGVGGGIFLSPLLLLRGWAGQKETSATSALFILVNSIAALAGHMLVMPALPTSVPIMAAAAISGGIIGSAAGSRIFPSPAIARILAVVVAIAGIKMLAI